MNAKITLSIDMKDVPQEVNNILLKIDYQLDALRHMTIKTIDEKNELAKLSLIEEMRKKLSLLDASYEDCYTVLVGFLKVAVEKHLQQMSVPRRTEENNDKQQNG